MSKITFYFDDEPIGTMEADDLQAVVSTEAVEAKETILKVGQHFVAAAKAFSLTMKYVSPALRRMLEEMKAYQEACEEEAHRAVEEYKQRRGIVYPIATGKHKVDNWIDDACGGEIQYREVQE